MNSGLKTINILQAAEADLRLMERKRRKEADPDMRYSFAQRDVKRARDALHLVALAYFEKPVRTDKWSTLLIYTDRDLLRRTLIEMLGGTDAGLVDRTPDNSTRAKDTAATASDPGADALGNTAQVQGDFIERVRSD
jgi:hypothetical protein